MKEDIQGQRRIVLILKHSWTTAMRKHSLQKLTKYSHKKVTAALNALLDRGIIDWEDRKITQSKKRIKNRTFKHYFLVDKENCEV